MIKKILFIVVFTMDACLRFFKLLSPYALRSKTCTGADMGTTSSPYRDFAENLRRLSASRGSIAQACRDLGMNRQQFNKYLSGTNLPGPASLDKISRYFNVEVRAMFDNPALDYGGKDESPISALGHLGGGILSAIVKGLLHSRDVQLREGCYLMHFPWVHKPSDILRSMMVVFKAGDVTCFRRYTRVVSPTNPKVRFSHGRHDGIVVELNGRTFLLAQNTKGFGELSLASFGSTASPSLTTMVGLAMVFGLSEPIATRVTLSYFGKQKEFHKALKMCGIIPEGSPEIPESIKQGVSDRESANPGIIMPFGMFDDMHL